MRSRHIAPVALVLGLTLAGFILAGQLGERDARRESARRADVAAAQIRGRIAQAASLTESLRRFMLDAGGTGVTSDQFAKNASRWLSPAGFPAAAWVERVPGSRRAAYERRIGQPIVSPDQLRRVAPGGSRSSHLPATLVSGFHPLAVPGVDLSGTPGIAAALSNATRIDGVAATPVTGDGLVLVAPAERLAAQVLQPGYVVVFVSEQSLRAAAGGSPAVQSPASTRADERANTAHRAFTVAAQRFDVLVPEEPVRGAAAVLPWIILGAGLVLAALAGGFGINGARRARAQADLDRIFRLSNDAIVVADFDGYYTRVNPAAARIMGYTEQELLSRPYFELIHPDDRERTIAEAAAIGHGKTTLTFENRYVRKDGSLRVLEWTSTPVVEDGVAYAMARDVTERRQAEAELARLAGEQAALRRVATLVARAAPQGEVFSTIAEELGQLIGADHLRMWRFDGDMATAVASAGAFRSAMPVGSHEALRDDSLAGRVHRTRRSQRIDDYGEMRGAVADRGREIGVGSAVATPVVVEGRLWGAAVALAREPGRLAGDSESRMDQFTELMVTAIANTESRARADRLGEEQAALRRVATLVAKEAPPAEVFAKVAEEMANVVGEVETSLWRDEGDGTATVVATSGVAVPVGTRMSADGDGVIATVLREGRPYWMADTSTGLGTIVERGRELGIRSAVGCPILVGGRVWGALGAARVEREPFASATEVRMAQFAELAATAIANADARAEVGRLAAEQAALRRVAVLVAEGASPSAVFDVVAAEMAALLDADAVTVGRYEPGDEVTVVAHRSPDPGLLPIGARLSHVGENVTAVVWRTERPARLEDLAGAQGAFTPLFRNLGMRSLVGAPIVVEGRIWGAILASWSREEPPPDDTEERMAQFAELLDTGIANADSRDQLTASRARLVTEADQARRRVVRDLHDGAQQRLVHTLITLSLAQQALERNDPKAASLLGDALDQAKHGTEELRELAHGILPPALTHGGLQAGVDAVVARLDVPIDVDLPAERFPPEIEASAYFLVAEALTNVVKHARAEHAEVRASVADATLCVEIRDDGIGGADPAGHGLVGMSDRVAALGGRLEIDSSPGRGTLVAARLPLSAPS